MYTELYNTSLYNIFNYALPPSYQKWKRTLDPSWISTFRVLYGTAMFGIALATHVREVGTTSGVGRSP